MNNTNVASSICRVNNNPRNRSLAKRNSRRKPGAMTGDQILREYAPPRLFHGRRWGGWVLDTERLCLVFGGEPVTRGDGSGVTEGVTRYTAFLGRYELDLERVSDCAALSDWIFQINGKGWATTRVTKDLLNALDAILHPQRYLCSGGMGKVIKTPGTFLRKRIATVGSTAVAA